jgi:hypothetical protein
VTTVGPNHLTKRIRALRRYRTVQIQAGKQTLTAAEPLPPVIRENLSTLGSLDVH